jgi:hypothetical protein
MGEINGGVTDTLALDLAAIYYNRDGFLTDVNDHHHSNSRNHYAVKGQALWNPTSTVEVRVIADYTQKADSSSDAPYILYSTRTRELQDVVQSPFSLNFGRVFQTPVVLPQTGPANQLANYKAYKIASNFARVSDVKDWGISGQVDWAINNDVSLTSISSYRDFKSLDSTDTDYSPVDFIRAQNGRGELRNITQELQLKGTWDSLDWLIGGFYSDETVKARRARLAQMHRLYGPTSHFPARRSVPTRHRHARLHPWTSQCGSAVRRQRPERRACAAFRTW